MRVGLSWVKLPGCRGASSGGRGGSGTAGGRPWGARGLRPGKWGFLCAGNVVHSNASPWIGSGSLRLPEPEV